MLFGVAKAQTITYTNMTAAGYQFKYIKADSGFTVPFRDTTTGRGTTRPGSIICNTADSLFYGWNGLRWSVIGSGNITSVINYIDSSITNVINYIDSATTNTYIYIDSSITNIINYVDSSVHGSPYFNSHTGFVVYDSLSVFHYTGGDYYILGRHFTAPLTYVTLDPPYVSEDRTDVFYLDTLGNFGVLKGGTGGLVPQVDPSSQIAIAEVIVPSDESGNPLPVSNVMVYSEDTPPDWTGSSNVSSYSLTYSGNAPYAGLVSARFPAYTNGQYVKWTNGATLSLSNVKYIKFYIRLTASFRNNNKDFLSVAFYEAGVKRTNFEAVLNGTYGFDRSLVGTWQEIVIPVSEFGYSTPTFDEVFFSLTGTGTFQLDNIQVQMGGGDINTGQFVQSVNGDYGPHVNFRRLDTAYQNADTSYQIFVDQNGREMFRLPTNVTYQYHDTCRIVDTINSRTYMITTNPYCKGLIKRLVAGTNITIDTTDIFHPIINATGGGGDPTDTTSLSNRINLKLNISDTAAMLSPYKTSYPRQAISLVFTTTGSSGAATGTYNNSTGVFTVNIPQYSGGTVTTSDQVQTYSGSSVFTFTSVPATSSDYIIFRNGIPLEITLDYTVSGNDITILLPLFTTPIADRIRFHRTK